jgi:hypothetical protein
MRLRSWLLFIAGLLLLPSPVRAQAKLLAPVISIEDSEPAPIFGLPALPPRNAVDVPVIFAGSFSSLRFNAGGLSVGLQDGLCESPVVLVSSDALSAPSPVVRSQMPEVPPAIFVGPLSHPRYDDGGVYVGLEGVLWSTNRPLTSQTVAVRGFLALDSAIPGVSAGTFVGSKQEALNTEQLQGPGVQQPGWNIFLGYRFQSGVVVELDWLHLVQGIYHASASLISPTFNVGSNFENTFLFSQVNNFSTFWAGPLQKFPQGDPGTTFGIWNGASYEQIQFIQRFDIYQLNVRIPVWDTADYRTYGIFGPRIAWLWDEFLWTTEATDVLGNFAPTSTAIYHNYVSNRLYGLHFGWGGDWWCGDTPIGGFAFTFEAEAALYADMVKMNAGYELADGSVSSTRAGRKTVLTPGLEARVGLWYYPWEAISINIGYDVITFFNTMSSHQPIDFNLGQVDPQYNYQFFRYFQGLRFGITFVF